MARCRDVSSILGNHAISCGIRGERIARHNHVSLVFILVVNLSPVTATTFRVINIRSIQISHLAAKTCKLVKLRT